MMGFVTFDQLTGIQERMYDISSFGFWALWWRHLGLNWGAFLVITGKPLWFGMRQLCEQFAPKDESSADHNCLSKLLNV